MTSKSRYFLVGSAAILLIGVAGGLVAYYAFGRAAGAPAGLPAELRYVPADAVMVAYADVHAVMNSEMRRELERLATGPRRGQQQMHEFAGIALDKDINHVVAYLQPEATETKSTRPPDALILAQGTFNQSAVEQFVKDHGGSVEEYHGKQVMLRPADAARPGEQTALAFLQPDLIALGAADLVRKAVDHTTSTANITANDDLVRLMRDASSGNAWVVGRFDAVSRRLGIPSSIREQVPPLRLVSASAHIDGGVKAIIKAETADDAAADQLRDVVRGAVSFVRLQSGSKPELADTLKSIEVGGTGTTVHLSFAMTAESFRSMVPQRRPPSDVPALPPPPPRP
jgi:hypothetical protein